MLSASLGRHEARFSPLRRLKLPYLVFISGIVLGVTASAASGTLTEPGRVDRQSGQSPVALPVEQAPAAVQPSNAQPPVQNRAPVFYYIIDADTSASALAEAIAQTPANGAHQEFVRFGDENYAESLTGLNMALAEMSSAGTIVKLIDLR